MIKLIFQCGGCEATAEGWLTREFRSVTGRSWGFGSYHYNTPQDAAPDGWMAFDPYTGCTYCPECWKSIEDYDPTPDEEGEPSITTQERAKLTALTYPS